MDVPVTSPFGSGFNFFFLCLRPGRVDAPVDRRSGFFLRRPPLAHAVFGLPRVPHFGI